MAEMVFSAIIQETVSRGVSFALGRREEKASQGHLTERLEMAVSELEFALERAMELPIGHLSLLQRRKIIKRAYVEAMELLDKHKPQATMPPPGQEEEELPQVVNNKRKSWFYNCAKKKKNMPIIAPPSAGLTTDDVARFEWYAGCAGRFVRDLESGCSLHHNTFCNPIVRRLLEGKTLTYYSEQGNLLRHLYIKPTYSDERGVEALLAYRYEDSAVAEKCFFLGLILRLTESTDLVKIAIKGLQLLAPQFKVAVEYAVGELTLLSDFQDIAHLRGPLWVGIEEFHMKAMKHTQIARPDPACCKGSRLGLCANNSVSSELADIVPDQIIVLGFQCYISALESKTRSSFHECRRSKNRGCKPPLVLTAAIMPHIGTQPQDSYALEIIGDARERRNASSIQQVAETIQSGAVNCFSRQPELAKYGMDWYGKHGFAWFVVEKSSAERALDFSNFLQRCDGDGCCCNLAPFGSGPTGASFPDKYCFCTVHRGSSVEPGGAKKKNGSTGSIRGQRRENTILASKKLEMLGALTKEAEVLGSCNGWREENMPPTATAEKGQPGRATTQGSARSRMR